MVQKYYKCLLKEEGEEYCGLTIKWDYPGRKVHLLMPLYAKNGLKQFQHPPPIVPQDQPHPHVHNTYGAKMQHAKANNDSPPLDKVGKKIIQEVTGVFLFLVRAVNSTMLTPLSTIASKQAVSMENTMQKCLQFLDYAALQGDTIVIYRASNMKLASYLSEPKN